MNFMSGRWNREGGYRDIINIAWPLILSTCSLTIQQFINRIFLAHHSADELAAAAPAGALSFVMIGLFTGIISYSGTFVSQYYGAKRFEKIAPCIFQSVVMGLFFTFVCLLVIPFADNIFAMSGHPKDLIELEKDYFLIMIYCSFIPIITTAFASFFIGIGRTRIMLWFTLVTTALNVLLDWILIFGHLGFPEMGIRGAAIGTQIASGIGLVLIVAMYFSDKNNKEFNVYKPVLVDLSMIKRIFKYGCPNGFQMMLEGLVLTLFLFLIGRISIEDLAATNIAFQVNSIAFMPVFGISAAASILVARELGKDIPRALTNTVKSTIQISAIYNGIIAVLYLTIPMVFINLFIKDGSASNDKIISLSLMLLKFLAVYVVVDSIGIALSSILKGAGDTHFVLYTAVGVGFSVVIVPTYIFCTMKLPNALWLSWCSVTVFVFIVATMYALRVKQGKWRHMRIIESKEELD